MLSIIPGYELDFFEWLVDKRLKNFPLMPTEGTFKQDSYGYKNIIFKNGVEYQELVIETEKHYPEFDFYNMALDKISLAHLDDFQKKLYTDRNQL